MGGSNSREVTTLDLWLRELEEDVVEPDREIIDPHHHLFDALNEPRGDISLVAKLIKVVGYSRRNRVMKLLLPKAGLDAFGINSPVVDRYLADTLQRDFGGHKVIKSVVVQAQWEDKSKGKTKKELHQVTESEKYYKDGEKDPNGFPHATVAYIDLNVGEERVAAAIKEHLEVNPNLRGFRHQLAWHKSSAVFSSRDAAEGMSKTPNFRGGLKAIEKAGLTFDIYAYHTQLGEVSELIEAFPNIQFILDHIGTPLGVGPYKGDKGREKARQEWERGLEGVAKHPNVVVKLSGLLMPVCGFGFEKQKTPPTSDELVEVTFPYYKYVIELFGVDRCMFASNFPVDRVSTSYVALFNSFKKIANRLELSEEDKDKLFRLNASRTYKLFEE